MNILMMSNTFSPHVGGVARSIERFSRRYRYLGHHVKVVAPDFDGVPIDEPDVIRVPAIRHFNHTDFSVVLPIPHILKSAVEDFEPDVIHSHHPFLLGGTALRVAHTHSLPLIFTHHTRYEDYTHNMPGDSQWMKRFVEKLATHYANLCDQVFVPSESVQELVVERGVTTPVNVVPTGVELDRFAFGSKQQSRTAMGIPENAFVVGHLGRLSQEKNIPFLISSIIRFLQRTDHLGDTRCLIVGSGPMESMIKARFNEAELGNRLHMTGVLDSDDSISEAYHAMDVFAFASRSETQGMVITEAMAAGVPVVALDAPGVREVVDSYTNGTLLMEENLNEFYKALYNMARVDSVEYDRLSRGARRTAEKYSMESTANTALELYSRLRNYDLAHRAVDYPLWVDTLHVIKSELEILKSTAQSFSESIKS